MIDIRKDKQLYDSLKRTRKERLNAFQSSIMSEIAERFQEDVFRRAPAENEIPNYRSKIDRHSFDDGDKLVALSEEQRSIPEKPSLVTFEAARSGGETASLLLSKKFEPFTPFSIPFQPDDSTIKVVFQETTEEKFEEVYKRNQLQRADLENALSPLGVKIFPMGESQDVSGYEDLRRKILKLEFGVDARAKPHWRVAFQSFLRGRFMRKDTIRHESFEMAFNARDTTYKKMLNEGSVPSNTKSEFESFQKGLGI